MSVAFEVLTCQSLTSLYVLSDSQIASQISVLNQDYSGSGLTFTLAGTTRTVNSNWFNTVGPDSSLQTTMKKQLRQGGANALNVYTVGCAGPLSLDVAQLLTLARNLTAS